VYPHAIVGHFVFTNTVFNENHRKGRHTCQQGGLYTAPVVYTYQVVHCNNMEGVFAS